MFRKHTASILLFVLFAFTAQLNAQQYNFEHYSVAQGLSQTKIKQLFEDSNGYIWITTESGGASRFDGKVFQNYSIKNGLLSNNIEAINECNHVIYFHSEKGINFLNGQQIDTSKIDVCTIEIKLDTLPNVLKGFEKTATCQLHTEDQLWIGTLDKGIVLYSFRDSSTLKITEKEGLISNQITSILEDYWGNIWIGSQGGLSKYLGATFTHLNKNNGLHGNKIQALEEDCFNNIWVATSNNGIASFDRDRFTKNINDFGLQHIKANVLYETSDHQMWMGTQGEGLIVLDSNRQSLVTIKEGLPSAYINDIIEDNEGNIWVSTPASGMAKIFRNDSTNFKIEEINKANGLPDNYISCMEKDNEGNIYFATKSGNFGYFLNNRVGTIFKTEDSLPISSILCVLFHENMIFIGTVNKGIYTLEVAGENQKLSKLKLNADLNSNTINLLAFDNLGYLWAGSNRGVNRLLIENDSVVEVEKYSRNEGFLGVETYPNSVLVDSKENLWFGTLNGLTRHKPSKTSIEIISPKIHFKDVALFYKPLSQTEFKSFVSPEGGLKEGLELPHHKNHLSFDFHGVHQGNPQAIHYQWQLIGAEEDWSPVSKKTSVNYSNLLPGNYTFKARAVMDNDLSSEPIIASFTIKEPYWQIVWVQLLIAFLGLLVLIGLANWRIKRFQKSERLKRQQLEMRNNMLQLEQKALQLQMNPHFIFNALNSIQSLVATQDYDHARNEINNFAILMRSILSNSKKQQISLEEEILTLNKYLELEQFCQPTPFEFNIETHEINIEEVDIPPMLVQPFVENAIIHGISHLKDKRGELSIDFKINRGLLECCIQDNGVGRKKSRVFNQSRNKGHQSVAMDVTVERLNALQLNQNYTTFQIEDLVDTNGDALGTKVVLRIPYESSF